MKYSQNHQAWVTVGKSLFLSGLQLIILGTAAFGLDNLKIHPDVLLKSDTQNELEYIF